MPNRTIYIKNDDIDIWQQVYSPLWLQKVLLRERRKIQRKIKSEAM